MRGGGGRGVEGFEVGVEVVGGVGLREGGFGEPGFWRGGGNGGWGGDAGFLSECCWKSFWAWGLNRVGGVGGGRGVGEGV